MDNKLFNMFFNKNESNEPKKTEEKNENELSLEDRLYLVSKNIDNNNKNELYENIIENKNLLFTQNDCLINDYVYNDVEFMSDHYNNSENGLYSKINNCSTKVGSILFQKILKKPINDIDILKKRQEYVRKILPIYDKIKPLIMKIKEIENDLIWFWDDKSMNHINNMDDMIYFNWTFIPGIDINTQLNENEYALLGTNIYKIVLSPILTSIAPIITLITPLILMLWFNRKLQSDIPINTIIWNYFKTLWGDDTMKIFIKNPTKAQIASLLTKGLYLFMYFHNIYYSIQS